jgi:hypothetical protein
MNKTTHRGILATQTLEQYKAILQDEQVEEVLGEIKPSRVNHRRKQAEKHEQRKKKHQFDD